jgi:hypothetical protein
VRTLFSRGPIVILVRRARQSAERSELLMACPLIEQNRNQTEPEAAIAVRQQPDLDAGVAKLGHHTRVLLLEGRAEMA